MSDNFKETVNLKDKMAEMEEKRKNPFRKKRINKAKEIDELYSEEKVEEKTSFKKINRPNINTSNSSPYKGLVFLLLILLFGLGFYIFFANKNNSNEEQIKIEEQWSIITLSNGKIYYGLVGDKTADPLVVKSAYSNYNKEVDGEKNTGGIKLFKQNDEIDIIRFQVESIESLDKKPEILKAILANEK